MCAPIGLVVVLESGSIFAGLRSLLARDKGSRLAFSFFFVVRAAVREVWPTAGCTTHSIVVMLSRGSSKEAAG